MCAGPADIDTATLTLVDALSGLENGTYTSEILVKAYTAKIDMYNPVYNAFTFRNKHALAQARASDAKRAKGKPIGSMEGVPVVIKEPLSWVGYPSTYGWNYTAAAAGGVNLYPMHNAAVTQYILDAGAIIMGKTSAPLLPFACAFLSFADVSSGAQQPMFKNMSWSKLHALVTATFISQFHTQNDRPLHLLSGGSCLQSIPINCRHSKLLCWRHPRQHLVGWANVQLCQLRAGARRQQRWHSSVSRWRLCSVGRGRCATSLLQCKHAIAPFCS